MKAYFLVLSIYFFNVLGAQVEPCFTARVYNDSDTIYMISGFNQNKEFCSEILNPNSHATLHVADEKPVQIAVPSGIYSIWIKYHLLKGNSFSNPFLVFEKAETQQIAPNVIGAGIAFRKFYSINPYAEQAEFRLLLDNTLVFISDKKEAIDQSPLCIPQDLYLPPFTS